MIEVKNITKVYGRGKKKVVALDNVSFTLPDSGMIFVVGKSGCGKSTLLNMIGGCDKLTAGDIVMDGNAFSSFRERDYDNFRDDYVGFIFQDYCLLEGLTVEQNVSLALELKDERDDEAVKDALEKVGLTDCAARRPDELSGGQKQRVAIARTLVKKPKLILADEPTGNLDEMSSTIILDILKELSATTLVVIVSHDRPDAEKYADRILELSDGKIVGDISRNPTAEDISFVGQDIVIQKGTVFTDEQLDSINERLSAGGARLKQADEKFLPTVPPEPSEQKQGFSSHRMSLRGRKTLFKMFAKKRVIGTVVTAFCIIFLIVVMGVCQLFTKFSPDAEIERLLAQEDASDAFIMQKGYKANEYASAVSNDFMVRVTDKDIAAFRETGYTGEIYPLYNVSVISHDYEPAMWDIESYKIPSDKANYSKFFCGAALGVLVTNEDFLTRVYGKDGKLALLSGTLETKDDAVIVTDYFADSFLNYNPSHSSLTDDPYQKLTTGKVIFNRYRVAGVVDTGYKERYKDLMQNILDGKTKDLDPEAYAALLAELNSTLNVAYSFNSDFIEAYLSDAEITREIHLGTLIVSDGTHSAETNKFCAYAKALKQGDVCISKSLYADLMQIRVNDIDKNEAIGKKLTLTGYERITQGEAPNYTIEVTIADIIDNDLYSCDFYFAKEELRLAMRYSTFSYALYFDDLSNITELYDAGTEMNYVIRSPLVTAIYSVSRAALVFKDMFKFIVGIMLLIIVLMLVALGVGSVKKNMYEIAVVRALGGKAGDLASMFLLQMFLVGIFVCIFSVAGLAIGANLCNSLLGEGFVIFAKNSLMSKLHVITFDWTTALIDAAIVLALTVIAAVVPFVIMRRAKPREIIRAKE